MTDLFGQRAAIDFTRTVIARTLAAHNPAEALALAERRWGRGAEATRLLQKAGVPGLTPEGAGSEVVQPGAMEFMAYVWPQTILGRLAGLRRVPNDVPVAAQTDAATGYWVGAGKARPLSAGAFDRVRLRPLRVAALAVVPEELLDASDGEAEVTNHLTGAGRTAIDAAFVDPANTGVPGERPASVTHDAPAVVSSGNVAADLAEAAELFDGSWLTASLVMHPRTALQIALSEGGLGLAAMLGPRGGGELATLPIVCSESVPYDSTGGVIALVDAAGIAFTDGPAEVSRSSVAAVEMDNAPTGDAGTPTGATTLVPLFQTNSIGMLVSIGVNWTKTKPGSVVVISGAHYGASS